MWRSRTFLCCHIVTTGCLSFSGLSAATLVVRPDGQGLFPTLQAAIDDAAAGDTVLALPGTYRGADNRDLDFAGKDLCVRARDGASATTIDCEYSGRGAYFHSGETRAAVLSGFHIIHGGLSGRYTSGGIRCEHSSPTLEGLWITGSAVSNYGGLGAIYSSLLLTGSIIDSNAVSIEGGAIGLTWPGSAEIVDCILSNTSVGGYRGGASIWHTAASFRRVHFIGNHAGISGGALYCGDSELLLEDCLFQGNTGRDGGAVSHTNAGLTVRGCTFAGNSVWRWGAAIYLDGSYGTLVENCDFRGNNSEYGGIIQMMNYSDPILRQLTLVDNEHGSAILSGCCYTAPTAENCLIAFNRGGYGIEVYDTNAFSIACSNVFGNESGGYGGSYSNQTGLNGNIAADPRLCDASYETLGIADDSPCLPEHNGCGVLMGNHGAECTLTAVGAPAPPGVMLEANYPNPFNPSTTIPFSLEAPASITLSILNVSGRLVRVLADRRSFPSGRHELRWDGVDAAGKPAPSGVYFYRLEAATGATARPMLLVK